MQMAGLAPAICMRKMQKTHAYPMKGGFLELLSSILFSTKNCLDFWDHHSMDFDTAVKMNIYKTIARTTQAPTSADVAKALSTSPEEVEACTGYLGYPFQYVCADDELCPYLFLFIHITGKLFHIALYPRILERISQVASTGRSPEGGKGNMINGPHIILYSTDAEADLVCIRELLGFAWV